MIFGFNIITDIPDNLAYKILRIIDTKIGQTSFDMPIHNSIRSICVNNTGGQYYFRVNINAGILITGKETVDIDFVNEPDFTVLDDKFKANLAEIIGKDNAEKLPFLREWILWIMRYGMDIRVDNVYEIMRVFAKTYIPEAHLKPRNAATMLKPYEYPAHRGKLEIYPKSELIRLDKIEYKETTVNHLDTKERDIIRLLLVHKRSNMGYAKRFLTKFEMNLWRLESFLNPLVATNVFTKEYLDTIGSGDFYKYDDAVEIIENKVSNFQSRKILIELLNKISEKGTIAKAQSASSDKRKFKKDLILLRESGINGALLNPDTKINRIKNPLDEILRKCKIYSGE